VAAGGPGRGADRAHHRDRAAAGDQRVAAPADGGADRGRELEEAGSILVMDAQ
jgi:hypothetical protein